MNALEIVRLSLLVAHVVGLAAVIGPFLLQLFDRELPRLRVMMTGAVMQVVTGIGLIASRRLQGLEVDDVKMVVKFAIALVILGVLVAATVVRRRGSKRSAVRSLFLVAGGFALANVVVAVMWA